MDDLLKEYLDYNSETGDIVWKKSSARRIKQGYEIKSLDKYRYIRIGFKGKQYSGHRIAWFLYYGSWPKQHLDHINGIRDDNRISNLREVSSRENVQNKQSHRDGKLVGTSFNKRNNKYISQIGINNKVIYLGSFKTELEAHNKYLEALKILEVV